METMYPGLRGHGDLLAIDLGRYNQTNNKPIVENS